jgi:hypothetical protein
VAAVILPEIKRKLTKGCNCYADKLCASNMKKQEEKLYEQKYILI